MSWHLCDEVPYWRRLFVRLLHVRIEGPFTDSLLEISDDNWYDESSHERGAEENLIKYQQVDENAFVTVTKIKRPRRFTHVG